MSSEKEFESFIISQKGMLIRDDKCLIVQINPEIKNVFSPLKWDLPGGRLDKDEDYSKAFAREMYEETKLEKFDNLGVVDYKIWKGSKYPVCGIINMIENKNDEITLSYEHCALKWISEDEIDNYEYCWPHMPEMMKRGFKFYKALKK